VYCFCFLSHTSKFWCWGRMDSRPYKIQKRECIIKSDWGVNFSLTEIDLIGESKVLDQIQNIVLTRRDRKTGVFKKLRFIEVNGINVLCDFRQDDHYNTDKFVVIFDLTCSDLFAKLEDKIKVIQSIAKKGAEISIVGYRAVSVDDEGLSLKEIKEFAAQRFCNYTKKDENEEEVLNERCLKKRPKKHQKKCFVS